MNKLKPCPFCGSSGDVVDRYDCHSNCFWWHVECRECDAKTGVYEHPQEAKAAWNRRGKSDAQ